MSMLQRRGRAARKLWHCLPIVAFAVSTPPLATTRQPACQAAASAGPMCGAHSRLNPEIISSMHLRHSMRTAQPSGSCKGSE